MDIDIKILDLRLLGYPPTYATSGSAGFDLRACVEEPVVLDPGEVDLIPSGVAVNIGNSDYCGVLLPRSGLGHNNGIILGNSVGLIDSDYRGQVMISMWNRSFDTYTLQPMEKIAQMIIVPIAKARFKVVTKFEESERGENGFGSTGK